MSNVSDGKAYGLLDRKLFLYQKKEVILVRTQKLVRMAVFVALCGVGAFIKIPSPTGTVALDSLAGYMAAALIGGWGGAVVGALGHMFSAWSVGFTMSLPIHLYIAAQMALFVSVFGYLFRKEQKLLAIITAIILNGVLAPLSLIPIFGVGFAIGMVPFLAVGSAINILMASVLVQSAAMRKVSVETKA